MSQRGRTDKRNGFKIYHSDPSTLDSSLKNDSTSRFKNISYSSGDQEIRQRNYHSSRKPHCGKSFKLPLVVRKDSDANDPEFRKHSDYANRHKRDHRNRQDHFLYHKETRREKPHCHKSFHHEKNNRGSESFRENRHSILENEEYFKRFSSTEVNQFSPKRNSTYNLWNDNTKRKRIKDEERKKFFEFSILDHKNNSICSQEQKEKKKETEECNIEGSARTRGFYSRKKEDRHEIRDKSNTDSTDNNFQKKANNGNEIIKKSKESPIYLNPIELSDFLKSCQETNETFNTRSQNETRNRCKSEAAEIKNQSRKEGSRSRARKVDNSTKKCLELKIKASLHSLDYKSLKIKKMEGVKRQEINISDIKSENISKNKSISSSATERSSESNKSHESNSHSSKNTQKKLKITEENKKSYSVNSDPENDQENESIRQKENFEEENVIFSNDSNIKFNEDSRKRETQEIKKNKIKNQNRKYKNHPNCKKTTLRYLLMYLIRKLILSEHEEKKNDKEKKIKILKDDSCISIKQKNRTESACESSGYDSLKNIQDQISDINKDQISDINKDQISDFIKNQDSDVQFSSHKSAGSLTIFSNFLESENLKKSCNDIEFLDSEKYCVYKVYKSSDGGILLKESHSEEFKKGEYVIGKRILKEPKRLLQFSRRMDPGVPEKNSNQLLSLRNNSTQTELNISSLNMKTRKQSWFRKSYRKKPQMSKKNLTSLESSSNSSFPESSDFEQLNLPFRKNQKICSPSSKNSLSHLPKPPAHFLKKSAAVDTSDLSYFTSAKNPENKMVIFFNSSENEKNIEPNIECKFLNLGITAACEKIKLEEQIKTTDFGKRSPQEYNFDSAKRESNLCSSTPPPSTIPVSWFKLNNSEFIAQKTNIEEMFRVQMENNSNFLQSTQDQIQKPELVYSEASAQHPRVRNKKKSKTFFTIFKRKKQYDRIKSEEKLKS